MGRTVPSYRQALEEEIAKWSKMLRVLRPEHRKALEELFNTARNLASAGSYAARPSVYESMVLTMLVKMQAEIDKLKRELDELRRRQG